MLVIFTQHSVSAYNALHTFPELSYIPHNSIVNILIILRAALFRSVLIYFMKINIFVIQGVSRLWDEGMRLFIGVF